MGYYTELDSLTLDELKQKFEHAGDYDDYYEEVAEKLLSLGAWGLTYLKNVVEASRLDEPQLCAAIWALSTRQQELWYRERLETLLQDSRARVVRYAINALGVLGARDLKERVLQLQTHPSPYVRGGVLDYMSRLFPNEAPPLLLAALKDSDPLVRESAIDDLDDLSYYQALPEIRPFLYNQPDAVRQAALTAVKHLTVVRKEANTEDSKDDQ